VTRLRRAACLQEHARPVQNKLLHRGRPLTRGTEVADEGGEEVAVELRSTSASEPKAPRGGLHTSVDVGELVGNSDPTEQRRPV
jgi:hypothetical protein